MSQITIGYKSLYHTTKWVKAPKGLTQEQFNKRQGMGPKSKKKRYNEEISNSQTKFTKS